MKYIKTFEKNWFDEIYVYEQYPKVVGKMTNKHSVDSVSNPHSFNYIVGYYIDDIYYHLNYDGGASTHYIYKKEWLRPATEDEIKIYNEFHSIATDTKNYNL